MKLQDRYDSLFRYYSELKGFTGSDWLYFKAQVRAESDFDPDVVSRPGAIGLAQFMPKTWEEWNDGTPGLQKQLDALKLVHPKDPEDSILAQISYMKWLLGRVGSWDLAFAAYNWGIGRVLKIWTEPNWKTLLPDETRDYIFKIQQFYMEYKNGGS